MDDKLEEIHKQDELIKGLNEKIISQDWKIKTFQEELDKRQKVIDDLLKIINKPKEKN